MTHNEMLPFEPQRNPVVADRPIGGVVVQSVDARELHAFLQVGKVFAAWIVDRIEQYGFEQGRDFEVFSETGNNPHGGRPSKEYAITLDMAKELSMVERNAQGKKARAYFIACERKAQKGVTAEDLIANPHQLLAIAQGYALQIEDMKRDMAVMQSDVDALERIAGSDDTFGVRVVAKLLQMPERRFIDWLLRNKYAYRMNGTKHLLCFADKMQSGLCKNVARSYDKPDGTTGVCETIKFTMKGLVRIAKSLNITIAEGDLAAARERA